MTTEQELNVTRQKHIAEALQYLEDGCNLKKASKLVESAKKDRSKIADVKGHPLNTLYAENDALTDLIENRILPDLKKWQQDGQNHELLNRLRSELKDLSMVKYHYRRKENSLYAFLIKYKIIDEETSTGLWEINDRIRASIRQARSMIEKDPLPDKYLIEAKVEEATDRVLWMIINENTVLLPILNFLVSPKDWYMIKQDELEVGYTLIHYPNNWAPTQKDIDHANWARDQGKVLSREIRKEYRHFLANFVEISPLNQHKAVLQGSPDYIIGDENNSPDLILPNVKDLILRLEVGSLSLKELQGICNVLPIDLTFVDKDDRVKWFSNTDRIFPRTRSVIGRPVIRCHPPRSIDKVMKILDDFHHGYADSTDFWVKIHGRTIYLSFYAVRDNSDNYLGCLELVQDVTKFQKINGEKTLEN